MPIRSEASPPRHQFFILGLWMQRGAQPDLAVWRISLEHPQTAERKTFADLAGLAAYLAAWMERRESQAEEAWE